jgi:hypothetical protein
MASFCIIRRIPNMSHRLQLQCINKLPYSTYDDNWTEADIRYHDAKTAEYATNGAIKYKEVINNETDKENSNIITKSNNKNDNTQHNYTKK